MPRVKRGTKRRNSRKKTLTLAKGFFLTKSKLYRSAQEAVEKSLRYEDFQDADEIFSSGNFSKAMPVTRIDDRELQPGPFFRKARESYWEFAHG